MLRQKQVLIAGALLGTLGVALGAFGAHAFKSILVANNSIETYELAVRYLFYHAFALLIIALLMERFDSKSIRLSATSILIGVFLFSGSLFAIAFKVGKMVVLVTPIGGVFLIAGWVLMLVAFTNRK